MPTKERRLGQVEESLEPREGLVFRSRVAIQNVMAWSLDCTGRMEDSKVTLQDCREAG